MLCHTLNVYVARRHTLQPLPGPTTSWMLASILPTDAFLYVCCASSQPCAHLENWWPELSKPQHLQPTMPLQVSRWRPL